jgi:hypothetical protein
MQQRSEGPGQKCVYVCKQDRVSDRACTSLQRCHVPFCSNWMPIQSAPAAPPREGGYEPVTPWGPMSSTHTACAFFITLPQAIAS